MSWISENWLLLVTITSLVTNVLNGVIKYYPGGGKQGWLRIIVDLLSWVANSNSPGSLKLPGMRSKPASE